MFLVDIYERRLLLIPLVDNLKGKGCFRCNAGIGLDRSMPALAELRSVDSLRLHALQLESIGIFPI